MLTYSHSQLSDSIVHFVGNPSNDDPLTLSQQCLEISDDHVEIFVKFLMNGFRPEAFYQFTTHGNPVYDAISEMFGTSDQDEFKEQSNIIAQHLYDVSTHPKILAGDLFIAKLKEVSIHNEFCDAIVILKAETEKNVTQVQWKGQASELVLDKAYQLDKIDKACLILSLEPGDGYRCLVIDKKSSTAEAGYWLDAFLELDPLNDAYYKTMNMISIAKEFIKDQIPNDFEVDVAKQVGLLNQAEKYFKTKQVFNLEEFGEEVFKQPEITSSFKKMAAEVMQHEEHSIEENFDLSQMAVKRNASHFKSVIKLDKNFHLYVHGNRMLLEKGFDDEKGMNFYKVFFNNETF